MYQESLKILKKIEQAGFKAYIVGGFVRNRYLNISSTDVDICTSATPAALKELFPSVNLKKVKYGSVTVIQNKIRFEITTFRKDIGYLNNRIPKKVKYINNLIDDLKRRDFTINTICIDSNENVIDLLGGINDINHKMIKVVGKPKEKLKEDALRILRAIRFATILSFELDLELKKYIKKYGYLLKNLSFSRKKEELDKIFSNSNVDIGLKLIKELELDQHLGLNHVDKVKKTSSIIGIWAQLDTDYPFSNHETMMMKSIKELLLYDRLEDYQLYHYGLYISTIVAEIKGISKKEITKRYNQLPIKSSKDIALNGKEISQVLNKKEGKFLKEIIKDLEIHILNQTLINTKEEITKYILKNREMVL